MIKKWIPFWTLPVIVAMSVLTVWLRLSIVRTTYSINEIEKKIKYAQLERDQKELKLAHLRSPRRLELLARTKFQLSQPKSSQVVHLK